jgi:hypothetical protein
MFELCRVIVDKSSESIQHIVRSQCLTQVFAIFESSSPNSSTVWTQVCFAVPQQVGDHQTTIMRNLQIIGLNYSSRFVHRSADCAIGATAAPCARQNQRA